MAVSDFSVFDPPPELSREEVARFNRTWSDPGGLLGLIRTVNNIPVAQRYLATGFAFFLIGGVFALFMRIQLGTPENTFLDAETYNQLFTMHGTTMMFLFVIPFIEALANYLLPLQLGTRDMPFPRLTALSFWTYLFGGIFLYTSLFFGVMPNGGWFAYLPLNNIEFAPGINMDFWDIGLSVAEISAMGAAAELIVAILRMRAPGMSLTRLPLFCWAMLVTAFMILFAFTPLIVGTAMLELDRKGLTAFFKPGLGGEPLLWQHLFWVFGHPEVYIMFLPAVGIVSHIVQTFSRQPIVGYPFMVAALLSTGFLSFGLWVHHMFSAGLSAGATTFFTATSMVIAIPAGVQVFSWIATLWTGRPAWRTPLLFVLGFLVIFTVGGVTGVMLAAVPYDQQAHDTFFVVAHFHYVLIGGVVFPLIAGLYYWLPKITGRMLSERLGRWNFWIMFGFFNLTFFPMHLAGLLGMPRRVYTYPAGLGWELPNLLSSIGAFGFAAGVLLFLVNLGWSLKRGRPAGRDPWQSDTLEWSQTSPPAQAQFQMLPSVTSRHPLWEQDTLEAPDPRQAALLKRRFEYRPLSWRGALVVSVRDGDPRAVVHVPASTPWPFVMAVGFVFIFTAALLENLLAFSIGAGLTLISLVGWFWPQASERRALAEESRDAEPGRLPLVVAGPQSNGFWGTGVLLLVLATALVTLVASYFYLRGFPEPRGAFPAPTGWRLALGILTCYLLGAGAYAWLLRRPRKDGERRVGTALALIIALGALLPGIALLPSAFQSAGVNPPESAYGSAMVALFGFQGVVGAILAAMTLAALLWELLRPGDVRGHAVTWNAGLVAWFGAVSALVVLGCLYLVPRIG